MLGQFRAVEIEASDGLVMDHARQKSLARPDRQGYLGNTTPKAHDQLPELPAQTMRPRVACVVCVISRCSAGSASCRGERPRPAPASRRRL